MAELHLRRQRWRGASRLFERIVKRDLACELQFNLKETVDSYDALYYEMLNTKQNGVRMCPMPCGQTECCT